MARARQKSGKEKRRRRYMKKNLNGHFMPAGQHNNEASWALCIEEGVVLGKFVGEQVFYGSTFLTYDMAYDGRQADTFSEGEEKRRVAPRGRTCCLWRSHVLPRGVCKCCLVRELL